MFTRDRRITLVASLAALLLSAADASAQTLVARERIGGYSEGLAFVGRGPLANHIALLEGLDVYGVPGQAQGDAPMRKLFDLRSLGLLLPPSGFAHVDSEELFAVHEPGAPFLVLCDHQGRPRGLRFIEYLNGYTPVHTEGLAYIPATSAVYPDHIAMVAYDETFPGARVLVMRRNGRVVAEIPIPAVVAGAGATGIGFLAPDRLLLTSFASEVTTIDFEGVVVAGPQAVPEAEGFEGIAQMRNGRVVAVGAPQDLVFFDADLTRRPSDDRRDALGVGANIPRGIAWNSDTDEYLVLHARPGTSNAAFSSDISAITASGDGSRQVVDLLGHGLPLGFGVGYMPSEHLVAVSHRNGPRGFALFDQDGAPAGLASIAPSRPGTMTYIPSTDQFVTSIAGPGEANKLHVYSRLGVHVRTIDLAPAGVGLIAAVAFFDPGHPSSGRFLVLESNAVFTARAVVVDFDGNLLGEFDYREALGLYTPGGVAAITTGPDAGAFAAVDLRANELVVFRLD
jgi:hypothetical protein